MGVSKNRGGPPKSSILIGFSLINHPFWVVQHPCHPLLYRQDDRRERSLFKLTGDGGPSPPPKAARRGWMFEGSGSMFFFLNTIELVDIGSLT